MAAIRKVKVVAERIVLSDGFKRKSHGAGIGDSLEEEFAEQGKNKGPRGVGRAIRIRVKTPPTAPLAR